eukprot:COSAG01_NODE_61481_length_289_cov_1.042105_1_plen_65_part_01
MSGAFPSCTQPILTEICLCQARSCQAIEEWKHLAGTSAILPGFLVGSKRKPELGSKPPVASAPTT